MLKNQQAKILSLCILLKLQAEYVLLSFSLYLHSCTLDFEGNELRAALLCRKRTEHFCCTSILQCVLSMAYLQYTASLHMLASLNRDRVHAWTAEKKNVATKTNIICNYSEPSL